MREEIVPRKGASLNRLFVLHGRKLDACDVWR